MEATSHKDYTFSNLSSVYHGKVRDVYGIGENHLVMVASNRISAFDVILPKGIPGKGAILNLIAAKFLNATEDICPNWLLGTPAPNVAVGHRCEPFKVEMVIRGYLTGHAWREYQSGKRILCGVPLPEGMKEHDQFPSPIITPATKADEGHDEDITREQIITQGIVPEEHYLKLEEYTRNLFRRGTEMAAKKGLILVDTKYEFGLKDGKVMLMDEIHTPDSSRYFYAEGYQEKQSRGEAQKQLSKEFVREWLIENGFRGQEGQEIPEITPDRVELIASRYRELFEKITGESFDRSLEKITKAEIEQKTEAFLATL